MTRPFARGDHVVIFNRTFSGQFIIEGRARIVEATTMAGRYLVEFADGERVERFVDPAGQDDPEGFVARLNRQREAGA